MQICQHHCPVGHVAVEFPAALRGRDRGLRPPARHPRHPPGHARPRRRRLHHARRHGRASRPTPRPITAPRTGGQPMTTEAHPELEGLGRYEYGWSDSDAAGANARRGLNEDVVRDISAKKNEPEWMLDMRLKGLRLFEQASRCRPGAPTCRASTSTTSSTSCGPPRSRPPLGGAARRHQEHLRPPGHPRGREAAPRRRCGRAVRVRGRLPQDPRGPRGAGRHLPGHRHRPARARGRSSGSTSARSSRPGQQVLRAQHRGVVRRLVHLRAAGRARRDPAAGLLPDQHREHGPVRADADHRRRGRLRALRRGLHRADLLAATRCTPRSSRSS